MSSLTRGGSIDSVESQVVNPPPVGQVHPEVEERVPAVRPGACGNRPPRVEPPTESIVVGVYLGAAHGRVARHQHFAGVVTPVAVEDPVVASIVRCSAVPGSGVTMPALMVASRLRTAKS